MIDGLTRSMALRGGFVALGLFAATMPATAQSPELAMLDTLESGQWELRYRGDTPSTRMCVRSGRDFIQMRHRGQRCNRYVVEDGQSKVTVQYSCSGTSWGRTSIRKESGRLVQIEGQGRANDRNFQFTAEARRVGACR
ncbi:DUF3617 family protein [Qipengyuania sp. JC766]|uniref:DUF3617 family protein n=1 Tax=Qipengyuania sp. JC766 TaxID=3232139 RepID=UPI00345AA84B